mmetsp:Transcript_2097/g.5550  ORF Transcript_2097/g.5550 Transcript_2097/m.5550 type:complete len:214 (+) Transcript_2097:89-730(+)
MPAASEQPAGDRGAGGRGLISTRTGRDRDRRERGYRTAGIGVEGGKAIAIASLGRIVSKREQTDHRRKNPTGFPKRRSKTEIRRAGVSVSVPPLERGTVRGGGRRMDGWIITVDRSWVASTTDRRRSDRRRLVRAGRDRSPSDRVPAAAAAGVPASGRGSGTGFGARTPIRRRRLRRDRGDPTLPRASRPSLLLLLLPSALLAFFLSIRGRTR